MFTSQVPEKARDRGGLVGEFGIRIILLFFPLRAQRVSYNSFISVFLLNVRGLAMSFKYIEKLIVSRCV
jgi:hypothetical protein